MHIRPTNHLSQLQGVNLSPQQAANPAQATRVPVDQVELSFEAQMLANIGDGVRADRVATIKSQIADGTYETRDKLSVAVDRLLDELA